MPLTFEIQAGAFALVSQPLLASSTTRTGSLMARLRVRAESILDTHNFVDALVASADHLAEVVGCIMSGLQNPWVVTFLASDRVLRARVPRTTMSVYPGCEDSRQT